MLLEAVSMMCVEGGGGGREKVAMNIYIFFACVMDLILKQNPFIVIGL